MATPHEAVAQALEIESERRGFAANWDELSTAAIEALRADALERIHNMRESLATSVIDPRLKDWAYIEEILGPKAES